MAEEQQDLLRDLDEEEVEVVKRSAASGNGGNGVGVEVREVDPEALVKDIPTLDRLTVDEVEAGSVRRVTIKSIFRAYYIKFQDTGKETPVLEFVVEDHKGKQWILRFKTMNIKKLKAKLGENKDAWIGKKLLLFVAGTGRMRYITFEPDLEQ